MAELDLKSILSKIKKLSDSDNTEYFHEKRFGHNFSQVTYYDKNNHEIAKVFKTNKKIDFIRSDIDEFNVK